MFNKIIKKIFSFQNEYSHKVLTVLGLKLKFRNNKSFLIEDKLAILINEIDNKSNNRYMLVGEPLIINNGFKSLEGKNNIKDDYLNLIKGLDDESIMNVQKFINRIRKLMANGDLQTGLFNLSKNETNRIREIDCNFHETIVQVDKDVWAYKNYLLPRPYIESPVFYDRHNLDKFSKIDSAKCIIDAGAFIGDSALIFSEITKNKVYAFEPTEKSFNLLNKTIELNNLQNVVPIKLGLSNTEGEDTIYILEAASTMHSFRDNGKNAEKITLTTIDKFVQENNLQVGLIKADIEGLESLMLEGAKKTICTQKPALIISIYHNEHDFFKIKPLIESLNLGYKFKITKPFEHNIITETCLLAEVSD